MRLKLELWKFEFIVALGIAIPYQWWFLPITGYVAKYYGTAEITLSIFCFIHFSIRIPWKVSTKYKSVKDLLPRTRT